MSAGSASFKPVAEVQDLDPGMSRALGLLRERPEHTAILSDFDGTLAALVDDPDQAAPLPGAREVLKKLVRSFSLVGVVSGRPISFLSSHLGGFGLWLSGLYGLESLVGDQVEQMEEAKSWRPVVQAVLISAQESLRGLIIEGKDLSLTLHFRTAPHREDEIRAWALSNAASSGLVMREAKSSIELHPPVLADKGSVVEAKIRDHGDFEVVCFLGDDRGDLPAFEALTRLHEDGVNVVRVGVKTAETPQALLAEADVVVRGPEGALAFLQALTT